MWCHRPRSRRVFIAPSPAPRPWPGVLVAGASLCGLDDVVCRLSDYTAGVSPLTHRWLRTTALPLSKPRMKSPPSARHWRLPCRSAGRPPVGSGHCFEGVPWAWRRHRVAVGCCQLQRGGDHQPGFPPKRNSRIFSKRVAGEWRCCQWRLSQRRSPSIVFEVLFSPAWRFKRATPVMVLTDGYLANAPEAVV